MTHDATSNEPRLSKAREASARVIATLKQQGYEAYLVGGCVRDILLGIPSHDYDVATSARPDDIERLFQRTLSVGKAFGVMVVLTGGAEVEVATFRKDLSYEDGRHPEGVSFCDAREDALRRDLTINALFMEPETGVILDYVGGIEDLGHRIIRTVGDPRERFEEDRLRTLRAVRFAARFGFAMDSRTAAAIFESSTRLEGISSERILAEFEKILTHRGASHAVQLLMQLGLLRGLLPDVDASLSSVVPALSGDRPLADLVIASLQRGNDLQSPVLGFATLLQYMGVPGGVSTPLNASVWEESAARAGEVLTRLSASKLLRKGVTEVIAMQPLLAEGERCSLASRKRLVLASWFPEALELFRRNSLNGRSDLLSSYVHLWNLHREVTAQKEGFYRLVNGDDLTALGLVPGPSFASLLREVEDLVLEGQLTNRGQALEFLRERVKEKPGAS